LRGVECNAQAAIRRLHHLAFDEPARIKDVLLLGFPQIEERGIEQHPSEHLLVLHGLGDMIDRRETSACSPLAGRLEIDVPHKARFAPGVDEVDEAAAKTAYRGNFEVARADCLTERLFEETVRA